MSQKINSEVTLPVTKMDQHFDVLVIGGGTAGAFAGIAAAREGKRVLICEREYALGGTATMAQVTPLMSCFVPGAENSSLDQEVRRRMLRRSWASRDYWGVDGWFHPEMLKFVLEEICEEFGVRLLYGAAFVNGIHEKGKMTHALFATVNGLVSIGADVFVDATGDANVAYALGCPCEEGDSEHHQVQAISLRFAIGQIDEMALKQFLRQLGMPVDLDDPFIEIASIWNSTAYPLTSLFRQGVEEGLLLEEDGAYFQGFYGPCLGGAFYMNCPEAVRITKTADAAEVTQAVLDCRRSAIRLHRFLQKKIPGFENSHIQSFAAIPGIREGRRIIGSVRLTLEDYQKRSCFPDGIAQTAYPVDIHNIKGLNYTTPIETDRCMEVPFGCMIPEGITNLLVAGRCVSVDFVTHSTIRIQRVCRAMGEAAGIGAAMACDQKNFDVRLVDGALVRERMILRGGKFVQRKDDTR